MQFRSVLAFFFLASAVTAAPIPGSSPGLSLPGLDSLESIGKEFSEAFGQLNQATGNGNGNGNGNGANGNTAGNGSGTFTSPRPHP